MLIDDKEIEVRIYSTNRKHYEKILYVDLVNGQEIIVKQKDLPKASRAIVECICDMCGDSHYSQRNNLKDGYNSYCGDDCNRESKRIFMTENNPNPKVDPIIKKCDTCNREIKMIPYKADLQEHFTCSRECYMVRRKNKGFNLLNKETKPEKIMREYFEEIKIEFEVQKSVYPYWCDFYLPKYNLIVEVFGDYWHANPVKYGYEDIDRKYHELWIHDIKRMNIIISKGYKALILWEQDIYHNFDKNINLLNKYIK